MEQLTFTAGTEEQQSAALALNIEIQQKKRGARQRLS